MLLLQLVVALVVIGCVFADVPACASKLSYWGSYDSLASCLRSNTANEVKKARVLSSLRLAIENYAFVDIIKNPPNHQFTEPVDLTKNLNIIEATKYANDANLQQAFADAFTPLHDAHTRYNKPAPYAASFFVLPFKFDSIVDAVSGAQRLYLRYSQSELDIYQSVYQESVVDVNVNVNGWEILEMNNMPAIQAVQQLDVGISKDAGSRLNLALNGFGDDKGYFGWRGIGRFAIPDNEIVTFKLYSAATQQIQTLSAKWLGMYQSASTEVNDKVTALLRSAEFKHDPDEIRVRLRAHEIFSAKLYALTVGKPYRESIPAKTQPNGLVGGVPAVDSSGVSYSDYKDHTGILRISTFSPVDYELFRSRVVEAMHNFTVSPQNNNKLIVDLRANGGGSICLGYAVSRFLYPMLSSTTNGHGPNGLARYDMKKSNLLAAFAQTAAKNVQEKPDEQTCGDSPGEENFFSPCGWYSAPTDDRQASLTTAMMLSTDSWMTDKAVSRTRGGVTSAYSMLIHEGCDGEYDDWAPPAAGFGGIAPENVILLSDGLCGSTCAVFSSSLQLTGLAKTVVVGGYASQPQQFFSFPGGQVVTIEFLLAMAAELGLMKDPNLPSILPDGATFRFALREIYPWNAPYSASEELTPLEFVHVPAERHLSYTSPYPEAEPVFDAALRLFDGSCPTHGFKSRSGACSMCPPGALPNTAHDGCNCGYGKWDARSETCSWDTIVYDTDVEIPTATPSPSGDLATQGWKLGQVVYASVGAMLAGFYGVVFLKRRSGSRISI